MHLVAGERRGSRPRRPSPSPTPRATCSRRRAPTGSTPRAMPDHPGVDVRGQPGPQSSQDMLAPVTGQGDAVVRVNADLNFDQTLHDHRVASPLADRPDGAGGRAPTRRRRRSTGPGAAGAAGGVLGTTGGQTATQAAASSAQQLPEGHRRPSFAVGKVTEQVKSAPGSVNRLSVAVLVDTKVKAAPAELSSLVSAAAGIDSKRGDVVTVSPAGLRSHRRRRRHQGAESRRRRPSPRLSCSG